MPSAVAHVVEPADANEVAAVLRESASNRRNITIRGCGSKDAMGGPVAETDVDLRLGKLAGILEYEPRDLTVRVAAGTRWSDLTAALAAQGQMLPLDPPCAARASVGGVIATNSNGPRRRLFGTARDMVIGMTVATLEGNLVQTGGMVVKNVAGLDTQKAFIGSFGTLAVMTSINFKLAPLPEGSRTFLNSYATAEECLAARDRVLASVLQPAAIDILNPPAARLCHVGEVMLDGYVLAIRAGGSGAVLSRYARECAGMNALEGESESGFWRCVQELAPRWTIHSPERAVLRVSHPLGELAGVLDCAPGVCVARAGSGVAYLAVDSAGALADWLLETAEKPWGKVVEWAGPAIQNSADLWPGFGSDFAVMERLKQIFDPHGVLNRGRLYGRI
jgi:glycolate oxidase FAD binding subunit